MNPARARRFLVCLPAAAGLALASPAASAVEVMLRAGISAAPTVLPTPLSAIGSAWTSPPLVPAMRLAAPIVAAPVLIAPPVVRASPIPAAPPVMVGPVVSPQAGPGPAAPGFFSTLESFMSGLASTQRFSAAQEAVKLDALFDGTKKAVPAPSEDSPAPRESRPGFQPHESMPTAILPSGRAIPPDSFAGGYHGTGISPDRVQQGGGLPARGPVEDWRLREHAEAASKPVSAFRGATPFAAAPDGTSGAAYWADEGGWVYQVSGVPTWGVNSELEGRVKQGDGVFRGNLMSEAESAIPAQTPLECIERWGQVSGSASGRLYVRPGDWVANPRYDPAVCRKFWGRAAP